MSFTHALSTNNYGTAKLIVDANAANGTHTTVTLALAAASSGDTIFVRPGTYTENLTLKAGVNITGMPGSSLGLTAGNIISNGQIVIAGTCTATFTGTCVLSNLTLQTNGANALAITGTNATNVYLNDCNIQATNATAIVHSTSGAGSVLYLRNCVGNISTTGITLFTDSAAGIVIEYCKFTNTGAATTASTMSGNCQCFMKYSYFENVFSNSGTSAGWQIFDCIFNAGSVNTTTLTYNSTNGGGGTIERSFIGAGTASGISIGAGATFGVVECNIQSSNTNAITGSGTINYGALTFSGTSSLINTTTRTSYDAVKSTGNITITNAQIKALRSSPVTVIAAPGSGKMISIISATVKFNYGGNNVFVTGGNLELHINDTSGITYCAWNSAIYTGAVDNIYGVVGPQANGATTQGVMENLPVVLTTATLDPTGNAANDNTMVINVMYQILSM